MNSTRGEGGARTGAGGAAAHHAAAPEEGSLLSAAESQQHPKGAAADPEAASGLGPPPPPASLPQSGGALKQTLLLRFKQVRQLMNDQKATLKVVISFLQVATTFLNTLAVSWPSVFRAIASRVSVVNVRLVRLPRTACLHPDPARTALSSLSAETGVFPLPAAQVSTEAPLVYRPSNASLSQCSAASCVVRRTITESSTDIPSGSPRRFSGSARCGA